MKQAVGRPHICDTPRRPEVEQQGFFDDVMALAMAADAQSRSGEIFITLAGALIRLLFASPTLQRDFMPALSHLATEGGVPVATFHIWDSESTGIAMRPAPCAWDCFTDRGDIWGFDSERFKSAFHWSDFSLNVMDMETGIGCYWVQSAGDLVYWAKASPLRSLFHWLMEQRGCQLLHAAAIGTEEGAVLVSGKGGVGKSTTALSCLAAGMNFLGDDYLVVQLEPEPLVFSLYATAKLEPAQLAHFQALQGLLDKTEIPEGEKAVLHLQKSGEFSVTLSAKLIAAMAPRFASQAGTGFAGSTPEVLVPSAAFTTMSQLPQAGRNTLQFIEKLMHRLPCYDLLLGHDIGAIPQAITEFIADSKNTVNALSVAPRVAVNRPLISVIIPVFNGAHFLRHSVGSILAQQYAPLEIIVVDDGSSDDIIAAVSALPVEARLLQQKNLGPAAARNNGMRNAIGEFFAFLDVDDLWPTGMLSSLASRLEQTAALDVVQGYGQLMREGEQGEQEFIGSALETFPYYLSAALYRRRAFEKTGMFDAELRFSEDTDWFTRARELNLGIERVEQVTLHIRRHDGNMTKDKNLRELGALRIFKKTLDRKRRLQAGL